MSSVVLAVALVSGVPWKVSLLLITDKLFMSTSSAVSHSLLNVKCEMQSRFLCSDFEALLEK